MSWPDVLSIDAWTGTDGDNQGALAADARKWIKADGVATPLTTLWPGAKDPSNWKHAEIGWGLILPHAPALSDQELAAAIDAPEPIRRLLAARRPAPVFRYDPDWQRRLTHLKRYNPDGTVETLPMAGGPRGVGPGCVPRYLLIYATPTEIPWELQFRLNGIAHIGRLDLDDQPLVNYVEALLDGWSGASSAIDKVVVWSAVHGTADITALMRNAIAETVHARVHAIGEIGDGALFIDGAVANAFNDRLITALADRQPGLVITTSHGKTGPLGNTEKMRAQLGLPVDNDHSVLDPASLLDGWEPDGAIWYAHACCSAGSDHRRLYQGLVEPGNKVDRILSKVAALGDGIAPLPRALLGATKPLRAFIGQVQPTFDLTLREADTRTLLTAALCDALANNLYLGHPVALAFEEYYREALMLESLHKASRQAFAQATGDLEVALACQLTAIDRQSLVVLGDPTAALPIPTS